MEEKYTSDDIKKINDSLLQMSNEVSKTYDDISNSLEERYYRIKKLMDSNALSADDIDFYQEEISRIYKSMNDCDYNRKESLSTIEKAISSNEEEIKRLKEAENNNEEKSKENEKDTENEDSKESKD